MPTPTLTITIALQGAAFAGYFDPEEPITATAVEEVAQLLTNYARAIQEAGQLTNPALVDTNGNCCGSVDLTAVAA